MHTLQYPVSNFHLSNLQKSLLRLTSRLFHMNLKSKKLLKREELFASEELYCDVKVKNEL